MDKTEFDLRVFEQQMAQDNIMLETAAGYARLILKFLLIVNGGAILALLTFLGNSKYIQKLSSWWYFSISSFCIGLVLSLITTTFAFWAQKLYREGLDRDIKKLKETDITEKNIYGTQKRKHAIISGILSIICFIVGSMSAVIAISYSL